MYHIFPLTVSPRHWNTEGGTLKNITFLTKTLRVVVSHGGRPGMAGRHNARAVVMAGGQAAAAATTAAMRVSLVTTSAARRARHFNRVSTGFRLVRVSVGFHHFCD